MKKLASACVGSLPVLAVLAVLPSSTIAAQFCAPHIDVSTPTSQFVDNNDGTITDKSTHLMWKKCVEGLSGSQCQTGVATKHTWRGALQKPGAVNGQLELGYGNWRLPNVSELESLVEERCIEPSINSTVFPLTPSATAWTSSPAIHDPRYAWNVKFDFGHTYAVSREDEKYVRLVRNK